MAATGSQTMPIVADDQMVLQIAFRAMTNTSLGDWATHPIKLAFDNVGITTFYRDLLMVTKEDVAAMQYQDPGDRLMKPLSISDRATINSGIAFFHHVCSKHLRLVQPPEFVQSIHQYGEFRISVYNPGAPITPWGVNRENKKNTELERWQKQVRPTSTDYKLLKVAIAGTNIAMLLRLLRMHTDSSIFWTQITFLSILFSTPLNAIG